MMGNIPTRSHPAWLFRKGRIAAPLLEQRIKREAAEEERKARQEPPKG